MAVWFKFAALEWWRSAKSGRDFLWLSLLLLLTLSLALLVWGSREGLLNRFMDVSLGYIPQVGIPILVDAVKEDSVGLDRNLLEHVKSMGINIHPYNLIEGSYDVTVVALDLAGTEGELIISEENNKELFIQVKDTVVIVSPLPNTDSED